MHWSMNTCLWLILGEQVADSEIGSIDPQMERSVEVIRNLVESYLKIVNTTQRDMVPKSIMHMVVNDVSLQRYDWSKAADNLIFQGQGYIL